MLRVAAHVTVGHAVRRLLLENHKLIPDNHTLATADFIVYVPLSVLIPQCTLRSGTTPSYDK